jgi:hypothetical protein
MSVHKLSSHGLPAIWATVLAEAHAESQVVSVVRDFVASITPEELAHLPAGVRPGRFVDAVDVNDFALVVALHNLAPNSNEPEPGLQVRIGTFFAAASHRLAQLTLPFQNSESA